MHQSFGIFQNLKKLENVGKFPTFSNVFSNILSKFFDFLKIFQNISIFFQNHFSSRKKYFFSMGFFLKFIYSFRRIDWERFQSASDNTNPPIIEKRVSIFWIIFLKISWKSLGLNGGWAKVTKNTMKIFRFPKKIIMSVTSIHFLYRFQILSKTLHGARR